jgi:hypothetical protein
MKRNASLDQTRAKLVRLERAKSILERQHLFPIFGKEQNFICFSQTQEGKRIYLVDLGEVACTCPDHANGAPNGWCKHLVAAWLLVNHPNDWRDWLPDWAKEAKAKEDEKGGSQKDGDGKLGKALAELSDEALERLILLAHAEQQERDYKRKVAEPGA